MNPLDDAHSQHTNELQNLRQVTKTEFIFRPKH